MPDLDCRRERLAVLCPIQASEQHPARARAATTESQLEGGRRFAVDTILQLLQDPPRVFYTREALAQLERRLEALLCAGRIAGLL